MNIRRKSLIVVCVLLLVLCSALILAACNDSTTETYQVTFNSNGGSAVTTQTIVSGGVAVKPADPTREGYTFDGWYKEAECVNAWDFANDKVTANVTVYAKWTAVVVEEKFTMTFNSQGGSAVASQTVTEGGKATKPTDPTRDGFTFSGWYKEAECTTPWDFAVDTATGDTTVYAKWIAVKYTITFITNCDSTIDPIQAEYNTKIIKPNDPERTGYSFAGWYKDGGLQTPWDFDADLVKGDTILYAKWMIESYTVKFDTNGGSAVDNQTIVYDKTAAEPAEAPTKVGHTFDGWYTDKNYEYKWNFAANRITSNTTIYAKWNVNKYTVTFESNGGSTVNPIELEYNSILPPIASPIKEKEVFEGWHTDPDLLNVWDINNDKVTSNITLYAKWKSALFFELSENKEYYILTGYDDTIIYYGQTANIPATYNNKPVKVIGARAFADAEIKSVIIPEGIERIEDEAFNGCLLLNAFIMPDSVNYLGRNFLHGNDISPSNFKLSPNVTVLPEGIFNTVNFIEYSVPSHITEIQTNAFDNLNDMLKIVYIPSTVTNVESNICSNDKHVEFYVAFAGESSKPEGWANDWHGSQNVIYNASSLPILLDGISYEIDGDHAIVAMCTNSDTIVNIPAQVTLKNKTYNVTKIKNNALSNLSTQVINIAEGITEIGDNNFSITPNLKAVWLPSSITSFGANAFQSNESYPPYIYVFTAENSVPAYTNTFSSDFRGEIIHNSNVKPFIENDYLYGINPLNKDTAIVLSYLGDKITLTIPDTTTFNNTEYSVSTIGGQSFRNLNYDSTINGIIFSANINKIDGNAFELAKMAFMYFHYPPETIASYAFADAYIYHVLYRYAESSYNPEKLQYGLHGTHFNHENIVLSGGVYYTVAGLNDPLVLGPEKNISEIEIPYTIPEIGRPAIIIEYAFSKNTKLSYLFIDSGVQYINPNAFDGCMNLKELFLPSSLDSITPETFANSGIEKFYYNGMQLPYWESGWNGSASVYLHSFDAPTSAPVGAHGYWHYDTDGKTIILWDNVTA